MLLDQLPEPEPFVELADENGPPSEVTRELWKSTFRLESFVRDLAPRDPATIAGAAAVLIAVAAAAAWIPARRAASLRPSEALRCE